MYKRILAAVNEHLNSEVTARYAMHLARLLGARLYLVFIAEKGISPRAIQSAEEAIKRLFISAEEMGIKVQAITETGDPQRELTHIVRHEDIDLMFLSTRRADVERRFYAGTFTRRLSLSLPCSVAMVRVVHIGKIHPREILVPLKARIDHVEERAYFAAKIAQAFDSRLLLFHSPKPISRFLEGEIHLSSLEWEDTLSKDISDFIGHMARYKVIHAKKLVPGRAGRTIAIEAFSKRHDLIIMGASQRSLLSSLLKGNPVEELLRNTPCDLILLKPQHKNQQL